MVMLVIYSFDNRSVNKTVNKLSTTYVTIFFNSIACTFIPQQTAKNKKSICYSVSIVSNTALTSLNIKSQGCKIKK